MIPIIILLGSIISFGAFMNAKNRQKENFVGFGYPMTVKVDTEVKNKLADNFYTVPGTYSAALEPRFSSIGYGSQIVYNFPDIKNLATPENPLSYKQNYIVKENYEHSKNNTPYFSGFASPPGYASSNYNQEKSKLPGRTFTDVLPVGDMTVRSASGEVEQPIVYDRFIYASQRSRLSGLGDRIRGDLPILPNNTGWFQVPVNPQIDLTNSALSVMSGDGETDRQLRALKTTLAGGARNTFGSMGPVDGSTKNIMTAGAAQSDIMVTSFP